MNLYKYIINRQLQLKVKKIKNSSDPEEIFK